jgi:hypothetical protein
MADIPIERKDHKSIWPWIIGIIVLLLILWFLFGRHRTDNAATTTGADTTMMAAPARARAGAVPAGSRGTSTGTTGTTSPSKTTP